jgi:hypothetical protein
VSPRVELESEAAVVEMVLAALRSSSVAADLARAHWSQAGTLGVKRLEPICNPRGKLLPLHLTTRAGRAVAADGRLRG